MNIFCPYCRAQVDDSWAFCPKCGKDLGSVRAMQTEEPKPAGIGFGLPDLSSFDALGAMANSCVAQDLAQQEAEALAPFVVEKHQNGKYAILALKDKSEMDVIVPSSVEAIGPNAFEGSDVLTVVLPEGLRKIGERAFADCVDLEEINFPKSLRVIGDEAFAGCVNLDVEPPEGVRIGEDAFLGTYPDLKRSNIIQSALDEIAGLMATAEALLNDDEDADDLWEEQLEGWYQKGRNYLLGLNGVEEDRAEGILWIRQAAKEGHADAQYLMALCYNNGLGVEKNKIEAKTWFCKAATSGNSAASDMVRRNGWD